MGGGEEGGCSITSHPLPLTSGNHQSRCWWRFRLRTERTSAVNLEEGEQVLAFSSSACRVCDTSYSFDKDTGDTPCTVLTHGFHLSASSIGSRLRSAVSLGSLNQDLMGIALSGEQENRDGDRDGLSFSITCNRLQCATFFFSRHH